MLLERNTKTECDNTYHNNDDDDNPDDDDNDPGILVTLLLNGIDLLFIFVHIYNSCVMNKIPSLPMISNIYCFLGQYLKLHQNKV